MWISGLESLHLVVATQMLAFRAQIARWISGLKFEKQFSACTEALSFL